MLVVGCLALFGCQPPSANSQKQFPIHSKIFDHIEIIGGRGVGIGQLNKPRSVAIDSHDNLFVIDMTGRVQKFSSNGVFLLSWQMPQTDLGKPKGMCRDHDGNIIVVEPHYQRVNHFTPDGKLVAQWGVRGTNEGQFILPRAVAINSHNEIFISEYSIMERVQKFKWLGYAAGSNAAPLTLEAPALIAAANSRDLAKNPQSQSERPSQPVQFELAFGQSGQGPNDFNRPEGLCVDSQDNLYVADSCNHRIQVYSSEGKLLRSHGHAGAAPGEFSYPYDLCIDKDGRQYVCEFGNSRIQVFDANDRPIEIIGGPGGEPGQFSNPWGVALDSAGNLYVADSQNHRVQKFVRKAQVVAEMNPPRPPAYRNGTAGLVEAQRSIGASSLQDTTGCDLTSRRRPCGSFSGVAQTCSLLYRRLAVCNAWQGLRDRNGLERYQCLKPRYFREPGRLQVCDTADYKSALRRRSSFASLRFGSSLEVGGWRLDVCCLPHPLSLPLPPSVSGFEEAEFAAPS